VLCHACAAFDCSGNCSVRNTQVNGLQHRMERKLEVTRVGSTHINQPVLVFCWLVPSVLSLRKCYL
jgi:hypothetical protein